MSNEPYQQISKPEPDGNDNVININEQPPMAAQPPMMNPPLMTQQPVVMVNPTIASVVCLLFIGIFITIFILAAL